MSAKPTKKTHRPKCAQAKHSVAGANNDPGWHATLLIACFLLVLVGFLVDVDSEETIVLRAWPALRLPVLCPTRRLWDVSCPACGLTRSVTNLLHGRLAESFANHRLGGIIALLVLIQFPYRIWRLTGRGGWINSTLLEDVTIATLTLLLIVNCLF